MTVSNVRTVNEFFAGIGLMRLGLARAGWKTVWANDIDADKQVMYQGHFVDDPGVFVLGDIHQLDPDSVPTATLATASFPCTDLSVAGGRRGLAGSGSSAFWGFIKVIKGMNHRKPPIILLENVLGFITSNQGNDFRSACRALNRLGYTVDVFMVDAVHFVPQSRQRLFVVGTLDEEPTQVFDSTFTFYEGSCRPSSIARYILSHSDIRWKVRSLPSLPKRTIALRDVLDSLPSDSEYWWSNKRAKYLVNQMSDRHRSIAESMIRDSVVNYGTVFRRVRKGKSMAELRVDGIAGCLRTPKGGSARQILFTAGNNHYSVRLITPRECARLMGAGGFRIDPSISFNKALFGFGDAVCSSVIDWLAQNYLNPLVEDMVYNTPHYSQMIAYDYGN